MSRNPSLCPGLVTKFLCPDPVMRCLVTRSLCPDLASARTGCLTVNKLNKPGINTVSSGASGRRPRILGGDARMSSTLTFVIPASRWLTCADQVTAVGTAAAEAMVAGEAMVVLGTVARLFRIIVDACSSSSTAA